MFPDAIVNVRDLMTIDIGACAPARDAVSTDGIACAADESIRAVLSKMAQHHVRGLPVLDERGHLQGVISIDDIVLAPRRRGMPDAETTLEALRAIVVRPTVADARR